MISQSTVMRKVFQIPYFAWVVLSGGLAIIVQAVSIHIHLTRSAVSTVFVTGVQAVVVVGTTLVVLWAAAINDVRRQAKKRKHEEDPEMLSGGGGGVRVPDDARVPRASSRRRKSWRFSCQLPPLFRWRLRRSWMSMMQSFLLFLNLLSLIVSVIGLSNEKFFQFDNVNIDRRGPKVISADIAATVFHAFFTVCMCLMIWCPLMRIARRCLFFCSIFQFIIGTLMIDINLRQISRGPQKPITRGMYSSLAYFQHMGAFEVGAAIFTFALCMITTTSNRLTPTVSRLVNFFVALSLFCTCLDIVYCAVALVHMNDSYDQRVSKSTVCGNIVLGFTCFVVHICALVASRFLQSRPKSHLAVEVFDMNSLTDAQANAFAILINTFGRNFPGAPSGESAISLMRAYADADMDGLNCKVLRVYKPAKHDIKPAGPTVLINRDEYEDLAWQNLDHKFVLPSDSDLSMEQMSVKTLINSAVSEKTIPTQLSKNQMKRLKRKANAGKKRPVVPFPLENPLSQEEINKEVQFNEMLMSTEALVLLTCIEKYDLTTSSNSRFYRILHKTLGGGAYLFKPLVVRMGLLGFHWPFRQATFYCSPTKRPVARSAAITRAITEWNQRLPRSQRCSVLLDPRYANDSSERAIVPSGCERVPLPSTHIIDLRPYKGKDLKEYLKAVKYRSQTGPFTRDNGVVEETSDFSDENCSEVLRLWKNIAEKRLSDGNTSVMIDPQFDLIKSLGHLHNTGSSRPFRSLLFLKVDGTNIASCVLFRLGDTITSDFQGLDHVLARRYKAYFVMMQQTIDIALREGISFVDFGPTTAKPKLDIGCQSIPLMGGLYAVSPALSCAISVFAKNVEINK
ncbi:LAMI_0D13190g1_1 [Lachancea mirantina]|uniref:LAMI_0D13190g1_1 n=1 Tax=Lachancea mirantina TaxID=1230905 RepID=A0A1G4JGM9_9SACH|nr:LAMI_0D13190g1_1 [Lachancea mirantina]